MELSLSINTALSGYMIKYGDAYEYLTVANVGPPSTGAFISGSYPHPGRLYRTVLVFDAEKITRDIISATLNLVCTTVEEVGGVTFWEFEIYTGGACDTADLPKMWADGETANTISGHPSTHTLEVPDAQLSSLIQLDQSGDDRIALIFRSNCVYTKTYLWTQTTNVITLDVVTLEPGAGLTSDTAITVSSTSDAADTVSSDSDTGDTAALDSDAENTVTLDSACSATVTLESGIPEVE